MSLLLLALSISAYPSLSKSPVLQTTELIDSDSFLEGAEFELTKQKNSCLLIGVGYGETGQNQYELYFDNDELIDANYISYRYS